MAQYALTPSGTTSINPIYDTEGVKLNIDSVKYNNSTNKLDIAYTFSFTVSSSSWYNCAGIQAMINGTEVYNNRAADWSWCYYPTGTGSPSYGNGTVIKSGTISIAASNGTTQSVAIWCKGMWNYGYSAERWNNGTGCVSKSGTFTVAVPGYPYVSDANITSTPSAIGGSAGSIKVSPKTYGAGTNGGSYTYYVTIGGTTGSANSEYTKTGLQNNVSYAISISISNSYGLTASYSNSVTLTPKAPVISSISTAPSRTGCTLTANVTYDNKRKLGSYSVRYGTSTSYGLTSSSLSLSSLSANTTYYYSVTATDANNGGAYSSALTSAAKTGSFKTTGNAPSITGTSATAQRTSATISATVTYDNTSFASVSIRYGTSTSYGSTSSSWSLSSLSSNTTYYYSVTVTDAAGRTSGASTGSFTTTGNAPVINSVSKTPSRTGCTLAPNVTYDNTSNKSYSVRYGLTTSYGSNSSSLSLTGLTPNRTYYFSLTVTDQFNRTATSTGSFTTLGNSPVIDSLSVVPGKFDAEFSPSISYDYTTLGSYMIDYGTSESYGSSSAALVITGLTPETTYYYRFTVTDAAGRSASTTGSFLTLSDQAKCWLGVSGSKKRTKIWIKIDGSWKKVRRAYLKRTTWKRGING